MASIDKAFIKAYARDAALASPASLTTDRPAPPAQPVPAPHVSIEALAQAAAASIIKETSSPITRTPETIPAGDASATPPATQWRLDRSHRAGGPATSAAPTKDDKRQSERPAILPLSAFAPSVAVGPTLRPAFEVDRFVWSASVEKLMKAAGDGFAALTAELHAISGPRVIGITGVRRGIGQSSIMLALARKCAKAKLTTAIVDADFQSAQLARQIGLAVRTGFDDVLAGQMELPDVLVESLDDRLTLLPLKEKIFDGIELKDKFRMPTALGALADHYDITLVDAGPLLNLDRPRVHCFGPQAGLTGILLVRDLRHDTDADLNRAVATLAGLGLACLGIIENFGK